MERIEKNRTAFLTAASKMEWAVVFEDERGVQIRRKRRYSEGITVAGFLLLMFGIALGIMYSAANRTPELPLLIFALGILVWIYGFIDLLKKEDELVYFLKTELEKADVTSTIEKLA